jgi:hypothetical protein
MTYSKRIVVGLMFDSVGDEDQFEIMEETIKDYFPNAITAILEPWDLSNRALDVLIFDYGGSVILGSPILGESFADEVYKYHQDHTSCIVICWTQMTGLHCRAYYEQENIDANFLLFADDDPEKMRTEIFESVIKLLDSQEADNEGK